MIPSAEGDQILMADSNHGISQDSIVLESQCVSDTFIDVNVVPEHEKNQLQHTIFSLQEEIVDLKSKLRNHDDKRRQALNNILDIKGSIRVFCRIRPYLSTSRRINQQPISVESNKIVIRSGGSKKEFEFDKVFTQEESQENIFLEVEPILRSALDGRNVCILAYGQTGTGKTFTMDGANDSPGIVPRAIKTLFQKASLDSTSTVVFSISMLEVYLGSVRDLLAPKPTRASSMSRCHLNIQTDIKGSVEIEGLTEVQISDFAKAIWWYTKGKRVRSTSWTNVNEASSRSHCLTRITIYRHGDESGGKPEISKLWMVDLGALRRKRGHIPYRNSKLTQILKDSLGDGSKVLMLVHASPCEEDVMETICSLTFSKRARAVEFYKELPEDVKLLKDKKISNFQEEMRDAEDEFAKVSEQIRKTQFLLTEKKKLFAESYNVCKDKENIPISQDDVFEEVAGTPRTSEMPITRSVVKSAPRFMSSTAASRQRHIIAEIQVKGMARSIRSGTRTLQLSSSQSLGYSDPRFKAFLKHPNKKSRYGETNAPGTEVTGETNASVTEIAISSGYKSGPCAVTRTKMVSSDPNLRVTLHRHRRRMSSLI
ncbi:Kinesin-like protein KIN-14U [Heracleum sosnowskyi]|uniref:Kinesin-like protein KIN-14U n=1 Tax=Heracleum sosnowskyi TaxID=360622 RepID=A0AAD8J322_9APIA|nr:Kinesin-like protein KIN-14U [Heracleum sosnowskyi]